VEDEEEENAIANESKYFTGHCPNGFLLKI